MVGTVTNESVQFVWEASPKALPRIEYDLFIDEIFGLGNNSKAVIDLYGHPPKSQAKDVRDFLSVLGTDYIFTCPNHYVMQGYAKSTPVYNYLFDHLNSFNKFMQHDWYPECDDWICHGSEIPILFSSEYFVNASMRPVLTPGEIILSAQMKALWSNFARSGNPNSPAVIPVAAGDPALVVPLFTANGVRNSLNLSVPSGMVVNYRQHYCAVLDKVGYNLDRVSLAAASQV